MKLQMLNVYNKKSRVFFSIVYVLISISVVANFFSFYSLYFNRKSDIYYFLIFFFSLLFCAAFLTMFIFHSLFFKQLSKTMKILEVFKGNEKFLISFIQRVNELYVSTSGEEFQEITNILSDISEILNKLRIKEKQEEDIVDKTFIKLEEIDENINMFFFSIHFTY